MLLQPPLKLVLGYHVKLWQFFLCETVAIAFEANLGLPHLDSAARISENQIPHGSEASISTMSLQIYLHTFRDKLSKLDRNRISYHLLNIRLAS